MSDFNTKAGAVGRRQLLGAGIATLGAGLLSRSDAGTEGAAAADAAGKFFALPELHPMDRQEVATAIHVLQNKLLGRPVYRVYRETAKRLHEEAGG